MTKGENLFEFEALPLRHRLLVPVESDQYTVYTRSGKTNIVKALTAYEAVRQSGAKGILKVERIFNLNKKVFKESHFAENKITEQTLFGAKVSVQDRIRLDKNPILSPDELSELMSSIPKARNTKLVPDDALALATFSATDAPESADAPHPEGTEVHGDGFDEIIPAAAALSKPSPKMPVSEPAGLSQLAPPSVALEHELSAEEVANLLSEHAPPTPERRRPGGTSA